MFIRKNISGAVLLFLLLILSASGWQLVAQNKIALDAGMFYNFSTKGNVGQWVDEQVLAGDPASGGGGVPVTVFSPGWVNADIYYPAMVVLDLGRNYNLSSLWLFDVNDSDSLLIFTGNPASWQPKAQLLLNTYNTWRQIILNVNSRFLMFQLKSPSTKVAEIVLYGTVAGPVTTLPAPQISGMPLMQNFLGVNGFVDDPIEKLSCVGNLREYHNWGWDEGNTDTTYPGYPNNLYAWNPSWVSGPGWGFYFDVFYDQLKASSISVSPDLQGAAPYITGFNDSLTQHKPLSAGELATDPASYTEHADYMFQFAARYGQNSVNPALLKLKPDQQSLSGLSLVRYLENWNEPDKWWFTRGGYFRPDEFAAMCSADYDGHNNSLGEGKGMKNADPSIKMVMAGLASLNLEYVRCMKLWSDFNRNGFPADVLNFHHYSENGSHGISPEEDGLKEKLKQLVAYRDKYLPGKEIWLSEFGYDTQPESEQAAVAIDTNDIYEVQAQWILRSYLAASSAGIDKAFMYMLRDANALNPNKYNSSGLTNEKWNGHQPKKSWFYVNTMTYQLNDLKFVMEVSSGNDAVNINKYASATGDTVVYVVWCGTSNNTVVNNFELHTGVSATINLITPAFGYNSGLVNTLIPANGKVNITVTERPVFVRTTGNRKLKLSGDLRRFNQAGSALPQDASFFRLQLLNMDFHPVSPALQPVFDSGRWTYAFEPLAYDSVVWLRLWEVTPTGLLSGGWIWNHWSGVTAVDALLISYLATANPVVEQLAHFPDVDAVSPFMLDVADLSNNGAISALDALLLMLRLSGQPGTSPFPGGKVNFVIAANNDFSFNHNIFPGSPVIYFEPYGSFAADTMCESFYYQAALDSVGSGEKVLNIYFSVSGDLNLSAEM